MSKKPFNKLVTESLQSSHSERKATKKSSTEELKEHGFKVGDIMGEGSYSKVRYINSFIFIHYTGAKPNLVQCIYNIHIFLQLKNSSKHYRKKILTKVRCITFNRIGYILILL